MLKRINHKSAPKAVINAFVTLYNQGRFDDVISLSSRLIKEYPQTSALHNIMGVISFEKGLIESAIEHFQKVIELDPNNPHAYNNLGSALEKNKLLKEAIEAYNKAISIKPDYAEAYYNIGVTLQGQGKLEEAIRCYKKAISINPNYAEVYNNIGNIFKDQCKLEKALEAFNKALSIKSDFFEPYMNMGRILWEQGKLEETIATYKKTLAIRPDSAESYINLGFAFWEQGKIEETIESYKAALSINTHNDEAYWYLYGTSENIREAKKWIGKCLKVNPNHLEAKLTMIALHFYEGNKSDFRKLLKSSLRDHPFTRSFIWAFNLNKLPPLYFHKWALFDDMISLSKKERPFYEFGVWRAESFKYLIKNFKTGYGFDSFEGLPEDWHHEKAGCYSSEGKIPKVDGGKFIVGKFEDTLKVFFAEKKPMASIINFDADLYSSTICALNYTKSIIDEHTILIFDEFLINKKWEQDEYRALENFCAKNQFTYEVLAISFFSKQVAVRLSAF